MEFSPPVLGYLVKKGLQKGVSRATPLLYGVRSVLHCIPALFAERKRQVVIEQI